MTTAACHCACHRHADLAEQAACKKGTPAKPDNEGRARHSPRGSCSSLKPRVAAMNIPGASGKGTQRNPVPMQGLAGQWEESKREMGGSGKAWGCCCRRMRSTAPPADLLQEFSTTLPSCSLPLLHSLPVLQLFSPPAIPSTGPALLRGFHLQTWSGNLEGRTGRKKGHGESEDAGGREGKHFIGFIKGKILFPNGNWKANTIPQF